MTDTCIYLFRNDLRLADLPGLIAAASIGPILPVFVLDENAAGEWAPGGASRWWLQRSLRALEGEIAAGGGSLLLYRGDTGSVLQALVDRTGARSIHCSRAYTPWEINQEGALHSRFEPQGVTLRRFSGTLLWEPEAIANQAGEPFKVFTPFWRRCRSLVPPGRPRRGPAQWPWRQLDADAAIPVERWQLPADDPAWARHWPDLWTVGTEGARRSLQRFLRQALADYDEGRNHPATGATSQLSPHLHFGEISPREVWHKVEDLAARQPALRQQADKFLSELGWRDFAHHLLFHYPAMPDSAFKPSFNNFPWLGDRGLLRAWQQGQTGYPVVDAGMRELWHTGYMHNRIRMVTASFLCKHLLIHWRAGERWFWDTLLDADLANNSCGWQWVAGSGADAAPYFRIFNPVIQGQKFDRGGDYVRRWVPELAGLPNRHLHAPWSAPAGVLAAAGVRLGANYPRPVVDHGEARAAALAAYQDIRNG